MKVLITFTAFFLIAVIIFLSCKKDKGPNYINKPPVANAGADQSFTLSSCSESVTTALDGSGSSDPDNKITGYYWRQIPEQPGVTIRNQNAAKATIEIQYAGTYIFELIVVDENNSSSSDNVTITVRGTPKEYDLDITFSGNYSYTDNSYDYYNCFYYGNCTYWDISEIRATGTFSPFGQLSMQLTEQADSGALSYAQSANIQIYQWGTNVNSFSIVGISSVNLKKLRQQGGGSFTGTLKVTDGSVRRCNSGILTNLSPLNITGSIDTATRRATITIKGKTYL